MIQLHERTESELNIHRSVGRAKNPASLTATWTLPTFFDAVNANSAVPKALVPRCPIRVRISFASSWKVLCVLEVALDFEPIVGAHKLTLLHTAAANVAPFETLGQELAPDIPLQHVVDDSLLSEARERGGVTPDLNRRVTTAVLNAIDGGAKAVLCTCSSIGPCVEVARPFTDRPVMRVDDPMAEETVQAGSRIAVAATLQSTLVPTIEIVKRAAERNDKQIELIEILCASAWAAFAAGDQDGYNNEIVKSLEPAAADVDVIVLAQASMAGAADRLNSDIPLLTSPRSGFQAAIATFRATI